MLFLRAWHTFDSVYLWPWRIATIIGLYKTEVIRKRGPWKTMDDVEYATLEWVDWFNHRRLLAPIGNVPPAEYEKMYYDEFNRSCKAA